MQNKEMLQAVCNSFGVISEETERLEVIADYLEKMNVAYKYDEWGNIVAGNLVDPCVAVASHVDEVGVMVKRISPDGLLEFVTVGWIHPHTLLNSHVEIKTTKGMVKGYILSGRMFAGGLSGYELQIQDLAIDVGAKSAAEVAELGITPGNVGTYVKEFAETEHSIMATGLDNGIGIFMNLELASDPELARKCVFLFHRGEECGSFGAKNFANRIFAPYTVVLDYFPAKIGAERGGDLYPEIGKGATVVYSAQGYILDGKLKQVIETLNGNTRFQKCFMSLKGSTEVEHFQVMGSRGLNICVPARGFHGSDYVVEKQDIEDTREFVAKLINKLCKEVN